MRIWRPICSKPWLKSRPWRKSLRAHQTRRPRLQNGPTPTIYKFVEASQEAPRSSVANWLHIPIPKNVCFSEQIYWLGFKASLKSRSGKASQGAKTSRLPKSPPLQYSEKRLFFGIHIPLPIPIIPLKTAVLRPCPQLMGENDYWCSSFNLTSILHLPLPGFRPHRLAPAAASRP